MDRMPEDTDTGKTNLSNDISLKNGEGCRNRDDWLIFDTTSGILFLRKSRHRVIDTEDGELSIAFIITQSGENLDPGLYALDENYRAS